MSRAPSHRRVGRAAVLCAWCVCVSAPALSHAKDEPADTLVDALERERALWTAERDALEAQHREVTERSAERGAELKQEVSRARARHTAAWADVARLERTLQELDATLATAPRAEAGPEEPLEALELRLGLAPSDLGVDARITRALEAAGARVVATSRVTVGEGEFFLEDGAQTRGRVVRLGSVGALGVDGKGRGGVLVPTSPGGGDLQVAREAGAAVRAYVDGEAGVAPVVFYDPSAPPALEGFEEGEGAAEPRRERTWRDTVEDAAPVGHVILALGALALFVFVAKVLELALFTAREVRVGRRMLGLAHAHDEEFGAFEGLVEEETGALSRVVHQAVSHRQMPLELYENSVQAVLLVELARIGRGLSALRTVAAVAPLLGLLGTVVGMTATFEALTASGSVGDPQALSGGIAQALATTQIGLTVAVPALLGYGALRSWASRMEGYLEHAAVDLATHVREVEHGHHDHDHDHQHGEGA